MVSNIEYIKLVITLIISVLRFYYKFIMKKIDEKVEQNLYGKEVEYMKIQIKYNYINLKEKVETLSEDIKIKKKGFSFLFLSHFFSSNT